MEDVVKPLEERSGRSSCHTGRSHARVPTEKALVPFSKRAWDHRKVGRALSVTVLMAESSLRPVHSIYSLQGLALLIL
jgi:hypothetical protein